MAAKYPFLFAAAAFAAGIFLEAALGGAVPLWSLVGIVVASFLVLLGGWVKKYRNAALAGGVLFLCFLGVSRMMVADMVWQHQSHWLSGASGTYVGVVMAPPEGRAGPGGYVRYLVDLESVTYSDGITDGARGRVYAYEAAGEEPLRPGDRISMEGKVSPIRLYGNPGKINLGERYKSLRLIGRLYQVRDHPVPFSLIEDSGRFRLERWAQDVKDHLTGLFHPYMDPARLSVLMSLLFGGGYAAIPAEVMNSFSATGIVHILSVSGSHVALLFGFLYLLGKWLRLPVRLILFLSAALVLFYAFLAGLVPPVIRSVAMGLLAAGAVFLERDRVGLNLFGAAVLAMLLADPFYLADVSFQLSAGASAGILLFYRPLLGFLGRFRRMPRFAAEGIALSFSAQLLTVPVILQDFHVFPLYFIPANLFITPLLEWAIIAGLLAALASFLFQPLMGGILQAADYLLLAGIHGNGWLSQLPRSSLPTGGMTLLAAAAWYGGVTAASFQCGMPGWQKLKRTAWAGEGGLLLLLAVSYMTAPSVRLYVPDLGLDRGAVLVDGKQTILWYKAGPLPGYTAGWEWNSFLGYEGIFSADILLLNLEEAKDPIPLSMDCQVKEIWVTGGRADRLAPSLLTSSGTAVRYPAARRLSYGPLTFTGNGSGWLVEKEDRGVYVSGRRPLTADFPAHIAWAAGSGGFRQSLTEEALEAVRPEVVFYNGTRRGESYEDLELLDFLGIPGVNTTADGMGSAVFDGGWKIEK